MTELYPPCQEFIHDHLFNYKMRWRVLEDPMDYSWDNLLFGFLRCGASKRMFAHTSGIPNSRLSALSRAKAYTEYSLL
jgi:hypothetical protein